MLNQMHLSTDNLVTGEDSGLDWYMNKSFKTRTVKVLNSVYGGCCKMRFMDNLLKEHQMPNQVQPIQPKDGDSTCEGGCNVLDAAKPGHGARRDDHHSIKMMALAEDDEDDDIGKMTLKEMHQFLRKSARKSSKEQSSAVLFSQVGLSNSENSARAMGTMPTLDCSVQLGGLELHLDSSTSNSAESGDDLSPRGVATSCLKPTDGEVHGCEAVAREADCPGLAFKKRKSTTNLVICKSESSIEDDDCTLEMWQVYQRQSSCGKKSRRCAVKQAPNMEKHTSCESSLTPAGTSGLCSMNLAPNIDEFLTSSTCPSVVAPSLANYESESPALPCRFDLSEDFRENDSLKSQNDLATTSDAIEGGGSNSDKEHSEVLSNENGKIIREDVKSHEGTQKRSSLIPESSLVCSLVDSSLADESEKNLQLTGALSESSSTDVSSLVQSKIESICMIPQEPMISCETSNSSDHGLRLAVEVKSGQSPMVEESPSKKDSCISKPSVADSDAAVVEPSARPSETIRRMPKLVNNELADPSQKMNINEFSKVDHSEDSPPPSAEGFNIVERSISNVNMVCQPLNDEETFGSPVSLFSTERLDAEEDHESEQPKPSKILCKRKAISPLSRERLLQASKSGDRERVFHDLDKRGLKKLPRAFKGFIGRDTFSQERVDVYARPMNTVMLESSPPEKSHEKEEVLPGSPCHNRKKLLTSKSFLPNVSSLSSSYGDSIAAATILPNMQTSSPYAQRLSLVLNSSPSPPSQQSLKLINGKSSVDSSPSIPAKGILRSSSPTCQGACKCEECISLRCRAESAAEFSQRQMHDIEGLAVKLLKELNTMRCVVEQSLIQRNAPRADSPRSALSLGQVKKAASNAFETEKMAKSWLIRMARDCNRYCKIMRMQERKLTFADESGGQLCHVKLFHSQPQAQPNPIPVNACTDKPTISS